MKWRGRCFDDARGRDCRRAQRGCRCAWHRAGASARARHRGEQRQSARREQGRRDGATAADAADGGRARRQRPVRCCAERRWRRALARVSAAALRRRRKAGHRRLQLGGAARCARRRLAAVGARVRGARAASARCRARPVRRRAHAALSRARAEQRRSDVPMLRAATRAECRGANMNASRLDAWLKRTPPRATRLLLEWDSLDGVQPVYDWSRAEIAQDLSAPILFAIQDHCDDLRAKASYRVSWRDDAGKVLAPKTCNAEPESELAASFPTPVGSVTTEAATQAGLTAQLMRHVETRERMHNGAMGAVLKSLHDRIAEQATELRELRAENSLLRKRMRAA